MKKRVLTFFLMLLFAASLFLGSVPAASAAGDEVDEFSLAFRRGIENGQAEVLIHTSDSAVESMLSSMFSRYPILYHYYAGVSWTIYNDHTEVTITTKNLQDDFYEIPVVDSDDDLFAVFGLGLAQVREKIQFVTANGYTVTSEAIDEIVDVMRTDYHLGYMGYHGWSGQHYNDEASGVYDWEFVYTYFYDQDTATIQQWRTDTEQVALYLAGSLFARDMPDYLKVLLIHDWIVNNTRYNIENMDEVGNHTAYGALVKGSCVCMGYAEAACLLFQAAGIETRYISGYGTNSSGKREGHAWNALLIDGDWYMMDMTWDDPVTSDGSNVLRYDYFNVTSSQLAQDHEWTYADAPQCNGTFYNAEYVQQLAAQDTMTYSDYDASSLVTQAEAIAYFQSLVDNIAYQLPEEPAAPTEPEPQPPVTSPVPETQPEIKPAETSPVLETVPVQNKPEPNPSKENNGGILWIVIALLVLGGGGGAAFVIIRKKRQHDRVPDQYSMNYGLDNLPKRQ